MRLRDGFGYGANKMSFVIVEPEHVLATQSTDGNWVWTFECKTRTGRLGLISRNRFRLPTLRDKLGMIPMEPGSLIMERKMLVGIMRRAEMLAVSTTTTAPTTQSTTPWTQSGGGVACSVCAGASSLGRSGLRRSCSSSCLWGLVWLVARPSGESDASYIGQFLGAESVLLLSIALVLISTLPWVEEWFDGIDRAAIWHRRVAIAGLILLAPHILLSSSPHGTTLGGPLGAIGAIGLVALVVWAILPRWQSVVPAPFRGLIRAAHDAPGVRESSPHLRRI